jgi:predicted lipoprotein with Yx(FWY)xxD motif
VKRVSFRLALAATLAGAALAAAPLTGAARSAAATAGAGPGAPTVALEQTGLGEILVDGSGHTLYLFTRDRHDTDSCAKVPGCLATWPALTSARKPLAGPGVKRSLLATIPFHGHLRQVTYAGHPLYTYSHDIVGKSTYNIGSDEYGGTWDAVLVNGTAVD